MLEKCQQRTGIDPDAEMTCPTPIDFNPDFDWVGPIEYINAIALI